MSEIHIKPCPFCGSENISFNSFSISLDAYVLCEQCNASIEISVPWDDMDEKEHDKVCFEKLSALWNKRTSESNQPELNENQQIVLDWLKENFNETRTKCSIVYFWELYQIHHIVNDSSEIALAYEELNDEQENQVVRAFVEWVEQQ
ncbi:Lar family restriction alleviation protein [Enterococcus faecalis]|nr:Lar family restriction alleviation protein [Enterococcus faecalis]